MLIEVDMKPRLGCWKYKTFKQFSGKHTDFGLSLIVAPSESGVGEFDADPFIVSPAFLDLPILKVFIV